jgi:hypothetical protein
MEATHQEAYQETVGMEATNEEANEEALLGMELLRQRVCFVWRCGVWREGPKVVRLELVKG